MTVTHLSRIKKNAFGGTTTGTLCNRFQCSDDGMNLTETADKVTCKLCLKRMVRA